MSPLVRLSGSFTGLIHNISAALLALASALVFYQVITRFVIGHSATWTEILARAVIIWMVFLACGPAIRLGRMIPIDVIREALPAKLQVWVIRVVTALTAIFLLVLIWYGYRMTLRVVDQTVPMINVSTAWFYAALPVGALLALPGLFLSHLEAEQGHPRPLDRDIDKETLE